MENKKPKLIIVEGAIGSGKSSLAHNLRENMKNTTMFSLSSIGNDDKNNSYMYHASMLNMIMDSRTFNSNFILCRSFISNEVYNRLGKKDYDNSENFQLLAYKLEVLQYYYDVKVIILTSNPNEYERRLGRRDKFEYVKHTVDEALKQQRIYMLLSDELREKHIPVEVINNSGISKKQLCDYVVNNL